MRPARSSDGAARGIPRHGGGVPRQRHRSVDGRGLQPHQRSGRGRPGLQLSRHRQPVLLSAHRRPQHLSQRHRLRQHAALRSPGGAVADSGEPDLLDRDHAHRWIPLRSRVGVHAAVGRRHRSGQSVADFRYQFSRRTPRRAHDRGSVGHRELSAGPGLSRP